MTKTMDASQLTITRIPVPATIDAADAGPLIAAARIADAVCRFDAGHDHFDQDASEWLPGWQDQTDRLQYGFIAERDGLIVGALTITVPLEDGAENIEFDAMALPEHRDAGVEDALFALLEREAVAHGRTVLQTWTLHKPDLSGRQLASPTGWGSIPADDPQTVLMLAQGYSFEQAERNSVFDLTAPMDVVESMLDDAIRTAGDDYRLLAWTSPTPEEHRDGFAYVISRMSTDVPTGALVWAEETWDADRVVRRDARMAAAGQTVSVACAQHVPTGAIVAYNELVIGADHTAPTHQWGTLVLKEHRGHRLGALVKCANLLRWRDLMPDSPRVSTFNAEENRPMLDINEAIGFVPASYGGAWKKILDA
ncbi:GNAT family N-acetyltransferase [Microbacterium sp.]|uniref:GNAT family N-acetyltransferase n=1 Tax=Microbacterium sp. TaxID=51671 RepID=UPI003F7171B7